MGVTYEQWIHDRNELEILIEINRLKLKMKLCESELHNRTTEKQSMGDINGKNIKK